MKTTDDNMSEAGPVTRTLPRERLEYTPIDHRPPLRLPDGIRLIVWPVLSLEEWHIGRPMARTVIPPPQGELLIPDVPNWTWHEYGMRVGFWRLRRMFQRLGVTPTVTLNSKVCGSYPLVVEACLESGWELNAHGVEQIPMHKTADQRGTIAEAVATIGRFAGKPPRGWFGPGLTETYETIDYLAEAGIEYIGDWVLDDEPVTLRTTTRPIVALPYNFEQHDIVLMALQHQSSDMLYNRALDAFECLYAESAERAKVMAIACHPYLSGVPHRIGHVERTFEALLSRKGVVAWDGAQILDWYLEARA
jgi:allantoinase